MPDSPAELDTASVPSGSHSAKTKTVRATTKPMIPMIPQKEMAAARAGRCHLLLLLLGLWAASTPVSAKPKNMTPCQWFQTQHVQPSAEACNPAMSRLNKHTKHCKDLNTFLHEPFSSIAATCQAPAIACKNGQNNCHQSPEPASLTMCKLTSGKFPNCKYKEKHQNAPYVVACNPPQKEDTERLPLVPVHLDRVL